MKVKLINIDPLMRKSRIVLDKLPATLGRSPNSEIYLTDRWVSRCHCEIDHVNGTLTVRDIGSKHGTFVNGEKVTHAPLLPGDNLTVGLTRFQVRYQRKVRRSAECGLARAGN